MNMLRLVTIVLLVIVSFYSAAGYIKEKPDFIHTCHKQDKNFTKCSTSAVQTLFDVIKDGVPAIHLPPTDPLFIDKINILQGDGPVSVNATLWNVSIVGFGKTTVLHNSVDPRNYDFLTKMFLPTLRIDGIYSLFGRILVLPIRGRGRCWFEPSNVSIIVHSDVDLYQRDSFSFYNVTAVHVDFSIDGLKLYMGNLFDGLKSLEESTNNFLNTNWKPASESLNSVLSKTIEDILLVIMKNIFDNVPADYFVDDIAVPV